MAKGERPWPNLQDILDDALGEALETTGIQAGGICLLDEEAGMLNLVAQRGLSPRLAAAMQSVKVGDGLVGGVADQSQRVVAGDPSADRSIAHLLNMQDGCCWLACVPLRCERRTLGALVLVDPARESGDVDRRLLTLIGHQIGLVVQTARLHRRACELAVAQERNRLARDLHDTVVQSLYSVVLTARATRLILRREPDRAAAQLARLQELAQGALAEMRSLIFGLRPAWADGEARQGQVVELWQPRRPEVELHLEGKGRVRGEEVEGLSGILREALNNVARHGQTEHAKVTLRIGPEGSSLVVEDQGVGFDLSRGEGAAEGIGLSTMRERAEGLGGTFEVISHLGEGTRLVVKIPSAGGGEVSGQ